MSTDNSSLHYRYNLAYIVGILSIVVIVLLTVEWGDIPDLVKFISFGLTLTSLFLSLVAIIYSFFANVSFTQTVGTLQNASNAIRDGTIKLTTATESLEKKVEAIPRAVQEIGEEGAKRHRELVKGVEELAQKMIVASASQTEKKDVARELEKKAEIPVEIIKQYVSTASIHGLLVLHAFKLALKNKRNIQKNEDFKGGILDRGYAHGFLGASAAAGILDYKSEDDDKTIVPISIDNRLSTDFRELALANAKKRSTHELDLVAATEKALKFVEEKFGS